MKVDTILDQIDLGSMARPEFQRGYVWNREIIFARTQDPPFTTLEDTVMVRAGIDF